MTLSAGTRLGAYEIVSLVGTGGMGEVYRARDTRLDRTVAIKIMPPHLSENEQLKQRFEREARTISSLSHPHICTLFDIGHQDGTDYLVMEYLEGETLDRPLSKGPLTTKLAMRYGVEIADALDKAHRQGIIHRDLKPGNIMITRAGVKLLDFGLAKLSTQNRSTALSGVSALATGQPENLTAEGTILGTLQYMAPEQLEGNETDARTDIFALGTILYEMIAGRRAFTGKSQASLIAAILSSEPPPISEIQPMTPPAMDHVVRKCLSKDPDERWQSASDVAGELKWLSETTSQIGVPSIVAEPRRSRASWIAWVIAAVAVLLAAIFAARLYKPEAQWTGIQLGGPEIGIGPRISPDGHMLAFQAMVKENTQVAVMRPDSGNWQVLTQNNNAGYVSSIAWSPDGNRLYYDRTADVPMGIYSIPVLGGDEKLVLENADTPEPLPDGSLLVERLNAARAYELFRFWPDSGQLKALGLSLPQGFAAHVRLFQDGKHAVALGRLSPPGDPAIRLYSVDLDSGATKRIQTGIPDESITAFASDPNTTSLLLAARLNDLTSVIMIPKAGATPRTLFTLTERVDHIDLGADGSIYLSARSSIPTTAFFPPEGGRPDKIAVPRNVGYPDRQMIPLADGRIITTQNLGGHLRLVVLESGKDPTPIVTTSEETTVPVTTIGAGELAFLIGSEPRRTIATASIDSGRVTRRIPFDKGPITSLAASPDGKTIYCAAGGTIWAIPETGDPRKICAGESVAMDPGGQSLLVQIIEAPRARLLRIPLDGSSAHEIALKGPFHLTFDPLNSAEISRDGRLVVPLASLDNWYFFPGMIDLATGQMTRIVTDHLGDCHSMGWMPDGQVMAGAYELVSTIWKFTPEKNRK